MHVPTRLCVNEIISDNDVAYTLLSNAWCLAVCEQGDAKTCRKSFTKLHQATREKLLKCKKKYGNKKAELSQRWPRDAPYVWAPWKFSGVPDNAHGYFSWILMGFFPIEPINVHAKFEICSFPRSWDNRRYPKKLDSPRICPRSPFSKILYGLLFPWTLWMYWLNLKSVAFTVLEIGQSLHTPTLPFL